VITIHQTAATLHGSQQFQSYHRRMNAHVSGADLKPLRRRSLGEAAVPARPTFRGDELLAALRILLHRRADDLA